MKFNDTSNRSGIIQDLEFWTGLGDGTISGDTALLKNFTRLINVHYARTLARLQLLSGRGGAEDTNYTSQQFSLFDIESGVSDYQFLTDQAGNTITDITGVLILQSSGATEYVPLERLTLDASDALLLMSPNTASTGTPTGFIEKNNTVFFNKIPSYTAASGGKLFYRLVPSYFIYTDTTKTPGFVEDYHRLLSLGPAYDWLTVNKPEVTATIANITSMRTEDESRLDDYVQQKNPTRNRMTGAVHSSR